MKNISISGIAKSTLFSCILTLVSIFPTTLQAQELDWVRTTGTIYKQGTMIATDAADNVVSCGFLINNNIFVRKWDKFGNFLWEMESTSGVASNYEKPKWILTDAADNIITIGYRYTISGGSEYPNAIVILKYTPDGTLLYKRTIPGVVQSTLRGALDPAGYLYIAAAGLITGEPQAGFNLLKLDTDGNTVFISTHNFGSVHGIYNMRYRNGLIAMTGTTVINGFNCTTALFDDSGNYLWGSTIASLSGRDVEIDDAGNVYVVNTDYATGLDQDIRVTKYDNAGTILFSYIYDHAGNYETPARINMQPDGNLVISGIGSTPSKGYETFKLSASGSLMWEQFQATTYIPSVNFLWTNDATGETFITGSSSIEGGTAGLTLIKYASDGAFDWYVTYDSTCISGMGIAQGSDASIYVVGANQWTILHYFDIVPGGTCDIPTGVFASGITNDAATISWTEIPAAIAYHVQYKTTTANAWTETSIDIHTKTLTGLFPGTTYAYRVQTVCAGGSSDFSTIQQFTTLGTGYCDSHGLADANDNIALVWVGGILNASVGSGGYSDYTNLYAELVKGSSYNLTVTSTRAGAYTQIWEMWIDYNQDGDFFDPGEREVAFKSTAYGWQIKNFSVPNSALTGTTKMRVSLKKGGPVQTPCDIFTRGEVEDYTIVILPPRTGDIVAETAEENGASIVVYPNPTSDVLLLETKGFTGNMQITIFDLSGRTVMEDNISAQESSTLQLRSLPSGIFVLHITDEKGVTQSTKIIKQ
ncbi:MAG: GEVED domain-containing protein [Chitinophagales bacterium]